MCRNNTTNYFTQNCFYKVPKNTNVYGRVFDNFQNSKLYHGRNPDSSAADRPWGSGAAPPRRCGRRWSSRRWCVRCGRSAAGQQPWPSRPARRPSGGRRRSASAATTATVISPPPLSAQVNLLVCTSEYDVLVKCTGSLVWHAVTVLIELEVEFSLQSTCFS